VNVLKSYIVIKDPLLCKKINKGSTKKELRTQIEFYNFYIKDALTHSLLTI